MKILIVNTHDIQGGAARAAYRLHKALLNNGIESEMLVQTKTSDDHSIIAPTTKMQKVFVKFRAFFDSIILKFYKERNGTHFSPAWVPFSQIEKKINKINPDIVHLHWINEGMFRIEDLRKIKAPIVWSLHDNWAFTGGCHVKWDCEKFKNSCGECPNLGSPNKYDLSRIIFKRKEKVFSQINNITIVGLSRWIKDMSEQSSLLKSKTHVNIPNLIDTHKFKPFDREKSRELWELPKEKKLILFGAMSATSDINKGYSKLLGALSKIKNRKYELVVFGSSVPKDYVDFGFQTHYMGNLSDDVSLMTLYNAADLMIVPSLQENLSNVIMESLSCGTPVVAFDIGGNSDMIEHKRNGYLAKAYDEIDLAKGIDFILNNSDVNEIRFNARNKVISEFSEEIVVNKYIKLYENILHL